MVQVYDVPVSPPGLECMKTMTTGSIVSCVRETWVYSLLTRSVGDTLSTLKQCQSHEGVKCRKADVLFLTFSQNLQGDSALYTRQNPNGNRYGYECPEERDYYPYWHPTPWIVSAPKTLVPPAKYDHRVS